MAKNNKPPIPTSTKSNSYTVVITPDGTTSDEEWSVHQSSPAWVLTFVRWDVRDTLRTKYTDDVNWSTTRQSDPLVVENDCIQCNVTVSKSTLTDSMSATLVMTDVNYETDVAPGDFVFVNMLNWPSDARRVADKARARKPINQINDGFKGIFKVQSVRKNLSVDPASGAKSYRFNITGFAFTEFNNSIYFNQELIDQSDKNNILIFANNLKNNWSILQSQKTTTYGSLNVQDWIRNLVTIFLGPGIGENGKTDKLGTAKGLNGLFFMPQLVGQLLGQKYAKQAKDIYNFLFGIQQYASGLAKGSSEINPLGINPIGFAAGEDRFYVSKSKASQCQGYTNLKPEYWNQQQVWSILKQYTNEPLNELFSCFRISPNGSVMPTIVFRQTPFTTEDFETTVVSTPPSSQPAVQVTKFMNLPRWKISPAMVTGLDLGRDEAARINFVQYFSTSTMGPEGWAITGQTANKNYMYDIFDVQRSGLRPYVVSTSFALPTSDKNDINKLAVYWARILGDCLIGQHLKMNGTIQTVGIKDPVAVGDNLEFDGVVYHIEQITHICNISENGMKVFRTQFGLSNGVSKESSSKGTRYSEMTYTDAYRLRENDANNNRIIPGVSEAQDVVYRPVNPDNAAHSGNGPFQQPNQNTSVNKTGAEGRGNGEGDKK